MLLNYFFKAVCVVLSVDRIRVKDFKHQLFKFSCWIYLLYFKPCQFGVYVNRCRQILYSNMDLLCNRHFIKHLYGSYDKL